MVCEVILSVLLDATFVKTNDDRENIFDDISIKYKRQSRYDIRLTLKIPFCLFITHNYCITCKLLVSVTPNSGQFMSLQKSSQWRQSGGYNHLTVSLKKLHSLLTPLLEQIDSSQFCKYSIWVYIRLLWNTDTLFFLLCGTRCHSCFNYIRFSLYT